MWDVVTKRFRELSAAGSVVMNPMQRVSVTRNAETLSLYAHYADNDPSHWAEMRVASNVAADLQLPLDINPAEAGSFTLHDADDVHNMAVEASTRCISQRNRASTDSWENIAEMRKTVEMLRRPLDSFYKYERHWRKNVLRKETLAVTPENAWLMYRYGARPLASSAYDVLQALSKRTKPRYTTTRGRSVSSKSQNIVVDIVDSGFLRKVYGIQKTETIQYRAVSIDEWLHDLAYDMGISRKELMTLPWAMIPCSFVADWFVNFGDFLGAMADSTLLRQPLGECLVQEVIRSEVRTSHSSSHVNTSLVQTSQALSRARTDWVLKARQPTLATPGIVIKADFKLDDITRLADAFALIGQRLRPVLAPLTTLYKVAPGWNNRKGWGIGPT